MRAKFMLPLLAPGILFLAACDIEDFGNFGGHFSRDFHYSYPMHPTGTLSVETYNGGIEVSGWDQDTVDISGTKYGPTQQAADALEVSVDHNPDSVFIHLARDYERRSHRGAKFIIRVPRQARIDRLVASNGAVRIDVGSGPAHIKTSNGQVTVRGLDGRLDAQTSNGTMELTEIAGDVTAHTSNGRIRAERVKGALDLTTSNGSVTAEVLAADRPVRVQTSNSSVELGLPERFSADIRVNTSNGGITLHLPGAANAHLTAHTSNSKITSDFEMRTQGSFSDNHLDALLGTGGPLIDLGTSNGRIRIARM